MTSSAASQCDELSCVQKTRNIVVITFGKENKLSRDIRRLMHTPDELWYHVDLQHELDDPLRSNQVYHGEDSRHHETIAAVHAQPKFPRFICELVKKVDCKEIETDLYAFNCRTGAHRADTTGAVFTATLNSLMNGDGTRRFNVCHLPLHRVTNKAVLDDRFEQAREWVRSAWTMSMPVRVGEKECQSNKQAFHGFCDIWEYIELTNQFHRFRLEEVKEDAAADEDNSPEEEAEHTTRVKRKKLKQLALKPAPKTRSMRASSSSTEPPEKKMKRWDTPMDSWGTSMDIVLQEWEVAGPVELAKAWSRTLQAWNVDRHARQGLFLLSQRSPTGLEYANDIVSKLIKKQADGELVLKPSAFVHTACKNARESMMMDWYYDE